MHATVLLLYNILHLGGKCSQPLGFSCVLCVCFTQQLREVTSSQLLSNHVKERKKTRNLPFKWKSGAS